MIIYFAECPETNLPYLRA